MAPVSFPMKTNPVKAKLRAGQAHASARGSRWAICTPRGCWPGCGFDWLTLDMEHSAIDWSQAAMIFAAVADAGCVPLVRVPEGDHYYIKRALDAGAWGIVVPMVDTVEQARAAIAAAKYPPVGNRSVGGGMHSLNFDAAAGEYYERANDEILVVLQTESPRGVDNAEAIYSLPGCDAIFVGPIDLRFNMRTPDGAQADRRGARGHDPAGDRGRQEGRHAHRHPRDGPRKTRLRRAEQGMQFIAVGSDLRMMASKGQEILEAIRPREEKRDLARY